MNAVKKHWRVGLELGVGLSTSWVAGALLKTYTPMGSTMLNRAARKVGILCLSTVIADSATKSTMQTVDNYVRAFKRVNEEAKRNG